MSQTPRLSLPLIGDHSQKHLVLNDILMHVDAMLQPLAISRSVAAQPASPADGDCYVLPASPVGVAWSAFPAGSLVRADGGTWERVPLAHGAVVFVADETAFFVWTVAGWTSFDNMIRALNNTKQIGIGTTADLFNVLAVRGAAALMTGLAPTDGGTGDFTLAINKTANGNSAQVLLQKGYSSRAILGLLGDNHVTLKVSPDGSDWTTALTVRTDGKVSARWGVQPANWPMRGTLGSGGKRLGPIGMTATVNAAVTINRLYLQPVVIPYDLTAVALGVRITTGAAGNVRLGLYADVQGAPGGLVLDAGAVSTASAGLAEAIISQPLNAGIYWLAAVFSAAPGVNMGIGGAMGHDAASVTSASVTGYYRAFTYGALPANEAGQTYLSAYGTAPALLVG